MKIEFIRRGAATRLILIFAGWSTDLRYYADCIVDGWDTAVVSDYRDFYLPPIPDQYSTVYLFAYSLGVYAAAMSDVKASVCIAVGGTEKPVSDAFGIPEVVFCATAKGLNEKSLEKFRIRMTGGRSAFEAGKSAFPESDDILSLKEELFAIEKHANDNNRPDVRICWHRVYIPKNDLIFPSANQDAFWDSLKYVAKCYLDSPHAVDMACIVKNCIPDPKRIGEGFEKSMDVYSSYAMVQTEICVRIGQRLKHLVDDGNRKFNNLLEIGVGDGLLTREWSKFIEPLSATYVDLFSLPEFKKAASERYIVHDAETWLETTDEKFDIILSSSSIQWFANPIGFINVVRTHLNPGGVAILSTYVMGNLEELDIVRTSPIIYHSEEEYLSVGNIETEAWCHPLDFQDSRNMLMHLKHTGVTPAPPGSCGKNNGRTDIVKRLSELPVRLTYRPLIIIIKSDPSQ